MNCLTSHVNIRWKYWYDHTKMAHIYITIPESEDGLSKLVKPS